MQKIPQIHALNLFPGLADTRTNNHTHTHTYKLTSTTQMQKIKLKRIYINKWIHVSIYSQQTCSISRYTARRVMSFSYPGVSKELRFLLCYTKLGLI